MTSERLFPKQIPWRDVGSEIPKAIETLKRLQPAKYNKNVIRDLAVGFKSILNAMEKNQNSQDVFSSFIRWCRLYTRLQHKIDSNGSLRSEFQKKVPVCASYILASLQYQTQIANYHQQIMEICLSLFESADPSTMDNLYTMDIGILTLIWMPVDFVGDYITQRLCIKLIASVLKNLSVEERHKEVSRSKINQSLRSLILKLAEEPMNFEQISREILNKYNSTLAKHCTVFSVYCTKALLGSFELYKPNKVSNFWIDFNYTSRSVSLLCQLNPNEEEHEEFYIKIKIDRLLIENHVNCSVTTLEPVFFSTDVSELLLSFRFLAFTLPSNQMEKLEWNKDLIHFYNSYSSDVPTPNTIEKYLAEEDSPITQYSPLVETSKIKLPIVKLRKLQITNENKMNSIFKMPEVPKKYKVKEHSKESNNISNGSKKEQSKQISSKHHNPKQKFETWQEPYLESVEQSNPQSKGDGTSFDLDSAQVSVEQNVYERTSIKETSVVRISYPEMATATQIASENENPHNTPFPSSNSYSKSTGNSIPCPRSKKSDDIGNRQSTKNTSQNSLKIPTNPWKNISKFYLKNTSSKFDKNISHQDIPQNSATSPKARLPVYQTNTTSCNEDDENPATSDQVYPKNYSEIQSRATRVSKTVQTNDASGLNCDNTQMTTDIPELARRFFRYRGGLSKFSKAAYKPRRKNRKNRKNDLNKTDNTPKVKSVNLVKPLNFEIDSGVNLNGLTSGKSEDANRVTSLTNGAYVSKPLESRPKKVKTCPKKVEDSKYTPYSTWKISQKGKNKIDQGSPSTSPPPGSQSSPPPTPPSPDKQIVMTKTSKVTQNALDGVPEFCIRKQTTILNPSPAQRIVRSSSETDSILTLSLCDSYNEDPVTEKQSISLTTDIVRHAEPDNITCSPVAMPTEVTEGNSKPSSRETNLMPTQISLLSGCFDDDEFCRTPDKENTIYMNSPVYEDIDDEFSDTYNPQEPQEIDNIPTHISEKTVSPTKQNISHLKEPEKKSKTFSSVQSSFETHQMSEICEQNSLCPEENSNQEDCVLEEPNQHQTASSQGSIVSVFSDPGPKEHESTGNKGFSQNNQISVTQRKRPHCGDHEERPVQAKVCSLGNKTSLKDYDKLRSCFVGKLSAEKHRLLNDVETKEKREEINFDAVNSIKQSIEYHQAAIKENRTLLKSLFENLEMRQQLLQTHQSEFEKTNRQIFECLQRCETESEKKIQDIYNESEEVLKSYSDVLRSDQWRTFSKDIINSVNSRLTGYLDI